MNSKLIFITIVLLCSCSSTKWQSNLIPSDNTIAMTLGFGRSGANVWDLQLKENKIFSVPENIRPCCAYGFNQKIRIGSLPIPFFKLANTSEADSLGAHSYNATYMTSSDSSSESGSREDNGLIYTLRGGLLDIAHIRDTADMTIAMFYIIYPNLGNEISFELSPEIGSRTIQLKQINLVGLSQKQKWEIAIEASGRIAYQIAVAHEIAQWHGLRSFPLYPEEVSAYSPEDLYSNMLGAKIAGSILKSNLATNSKSYNQNFSIWLRRTIEYLRPLDKDETNSMMTSVDNFFWNSSARLPDKYLVLKRDYRVGHNKSPHLYPKDIAKRSPSWPQIKTYFDQHHSPVNLGQPSKLYGIKLDEFVQFKIGVAKGFEKYFKHIPRKIWSDGISASEFQRIAEYDSLFDKNEIKSLANIKK